MQLDGRGGIMRPTAGCQDLGNKGAATNVSTKYLTPIEEVSWSRRCLSAGGIGCSVQ